MFMRATIHPFARGRVLRPGNGLRRLATVGCAAIFALGYAQGMAGRGAQPQDSGAQGSDAQVAGSNPAKPQPGPGLGCNPGSPVQGKANPMQANPMQGLGCNPGMFPQGQGFAMGQMGRSANASEYDEE